MMTYILNYPYTENKLKTRVKAKRPVTRLLKQFGQKAMVASMRMAAVTRKKVKTFHTFLR